MRYSETVAETTINGYTIKTELMGDDFSSDPRVDMDNLGTMVCFHGRYQLGDKHVYSDPDEARQDIDRDRCVVLPLYLYDHSGITMRCTPFDCSWDSGQVGWIYVTKERLREEYGVKRITKQIRELAERVLTGEVETYDMYLRGDIWCYDTVISNEDGEDIEHDSLCGMYGDEYAREEAYDSHQWFRMAVSTIDQLTELLEEEACDEYDYQCLPCWVKRLAHNTVGDTCPADAIAEALVKRYNIADKERFLQTSFAL